MRGTEKERGDLGMAGATQRAPGPLLPSVPRAAPPLRAPPRGWGEP